MFFQINVRVPFRLVYFYKNQKQRSIPGCEPTTYDLLLISHCHYRGNIYAKWQDKITGKQSCYVEVSKSVVSKKKPQLQSDISMRALTKIKSKWTMVQDHGFRSS